MSQDLEHLRLLSIFHFVLAAMAALVACVPLIHLALGVAMVSGVMEPGDDGVRVAGCFFIAIASVFILTGWTYAACMVAAGRFLGQRRRYTFCLVMAAISCLFMPFGTVLGVFTIIVLTRDSVKELFA
jgi:hypothetical protein